MLCLGFNDHKNNTKISNGRNKISQFGQKKNKQKKPNTSKTLTKNLRKLQTLDKDIPMFGSKRSNILTFTREVPCLQGDGKKDKYECDMAILTVIYICRSV